MPIIQHDPRYRRIWMFPRNIRRIPPWKLMQIITLLSQQTRYDEWSGNQCLQDDFIKALDHANLKRPSNLRDSNSGGARTYISQLQCLGLAYKNRTSLELTKAGRDLQNSISPLEILQKQLLRHQYPSNYSQGRNVRIHPAIKIKPFLFILQLLNDRDITNLTTIEMVIPILYGHNQDCYNVCKEKILHYRRNNDLLSIIDNLEFDLYTPRTQNRTIESALDDIKNIANTCKNYLQGSCLVNVVKEKRIEQISFNESFRSLYNEEKTNEDRYIRNPENIESFQRAYGAWDRIKDTHISTQRSTSVSKGENIILSCFMDYCGNNLVVDDVDDFIAQMNQNFGFPNDLILEVVEPFIHRTLSIFESSYLQLSIGGTATATEFEKTTGKLFEKKMGFIVEHTGQKHRANGVGGYSDLLLIDETQEFCAVIDTKASPKYNFNSSDYAKLVSNYIPNYQELLENEKPLEFCAYVAGGFSGNIDEKLIQVKDETNVPVSSITAKNILKVANDSVLCDVQSKIRRGFTISKILDHTDFMKKT